MPDISKEQVRQIVRDYFVREWQEANDAHWCIVRDNQLDIEDELADIQEGEKQLRERLSRHQFSKDVKETALKLVDERGLAPSLSSEQMAQVCDGIVRAMIQHRHILAAKLRGDAEKAYPTDPLFSGIEDPGLPDLQMANPAGNSQAQEKGGLGHAIEQYLNDMTFRKFGQKGIEDKRRSLNWAIELLGGPGRNVGSITPDEVRDVRNIIQRLPKSFTTKKEYKGKRLREIVELPNIVPVDAETATKQFGALKSFLKWAEDEGFFVGKASPAVTVSIKKGKKSTRPRYPFSAEQLNALFSSPVYTGCASAARRSTPGEQIIKDSKYWVPLVGITTGMRLGEICQLLVSDIKVADKLVSIDVCKSEDDGADGNDKRLKTSSSEREL